MEKERTLVLLKPDTVSKSISGKIITRFEETGLKLAGMKMIWADEVMAQKHYPLDMNWAKNVYEKTKASYDKEGREMKHDSPESLGKEIQSWLINFLREGPVIAMVLEGPHAIELVRKMIGSTEPRQASPGTIRGDFASIESYASADSRKESVRNLVHASDSKENAEREIAVWFNPDEIHNYKTVNDRD